MKPSRRAFASALGATLCTSALRPASAADGAFAFAAADGARLTGWALTSPLAGARMRPIVLLFHQAGSSHAEYAPVQPQLARLGLDSIAIDQRSGGDLFGPNATVAARGGSASAYEDVLPDILGTIDVATARRAARKVILWGSSYSSALVFVAARRRRTVVDAILAFSPSEYLRDPHAVARAAAELTVPAFVCETRDERAAAAPIVRALRGAVEFVPEHGVHGSSTLRADRNPAGAQDVWNAVRPFLASRRPVAG